MPLPPARAITAKDRFRETKSRLARWIGQPTSGMRTDLTCHGRPVLFFHNPKTGGNSLARLLHVKRLSHAYPSERLSERVWLRAMSVAVVRDPFARFLSGYRAHVLRPDSNGLVKIYGWEFKAISPFDYLGALAAYPRYGGPQTLWTDYPCAAKPRVDLVLRSEQSDQWPAQLAAAGIDVSGRALPHLNRTEGAESDRAEAIGLSAAEFTRLRYAAETHFADDYATFGYPRHS